MVLERAGQDAAAAELLARELEVNPDGVAVSAPDRAMLDYALKLTRTPGEMDAEDVAQLRGHDFDDRAIHDICAITSYYAFVNRMAHGLGVELESRFDVTTP